MCNPIFILRYINMSAFKPNVSNIDRLDFQILQNGWTNVYWQERILLTDLHWFEKENYKIVELDCTRWTASNRLLYELGLLLDFPDYYGKNLDALNDCLSNIEITDAGTVVVFKHFQTIEKSFAFTLLDIFALNARRHLLFGKKLLTLVQVDDPTYHMEPIGATSVLWNNAEGLDAARGV